MANDSIIITGGTGFVGRHLIRELQERSSFSRVVSFDRIVDDIPAGATGYGVDITDSTTYAHLLREIQPDWVIHLAAVSSVGFSLTHPDITRTTNVFATEELMKNALAARSDTKFLIVSSADIYGISSPTAIPELLLSACHPSNPYAQSKFEMEQMVEEKYNEHCIRVRPFPHIGPGQRTGFVTADFSSQIAAIEKGKQAPEILVGNLEAKRDFTDVRDVVRAYRLLIEKGMFGEVYHIASGQAYSIQHVLDSLLAMSTSPITVQQDESRMRPSDTPVLIGAIDKITAETGWKPEIPLQTSLQDILNDWRTKD
ncbi:MAG TPA: GDP-mannose 4,6-dehydratase [Candidatus Andersenbacteria bacterium]|nr:GDP-mannose 4,6-dehydratase [Candidatus Andersenbacteria bacterium]